MPRRVLFVLAGIFVALSAASRAQETARVVIVSARVGEVIDRAERDAYKLFGSIPDFQSAIFFLLPDSVYAGQVTRGIAGSTSDTLVWYSGPALEALGERIDHFEKFANFEYQLGSEPAVLAYGRAVPLAEVGTAEARARRPVRAVPAPAPVPPAVDSVRIDSIHIPSGTVPGIRNREPILLPPCAKQDAIIPRLCDTLDAYAWRYYGFVPALQGVTGASLERTVDGALLRVRMRDGDTSISLSEKESQLLADFIRDYERKMRYYDGDSTLTAESIIRLGYAQRFVPLLERGLLALRRSGEPASQVIVRTVRGEVLYGNLQYASEEAVYLSKTEDAWSAWNAWDGSAEIRRIERHHLVSIRLGGDTRFSSGFFYGWLVTTAILSQPIGAAIAESDPTGGNGIYSVMGVLISAFVSLPAGFIIGLLAQIGDPMAGAEDIRMWGGKSGLPAQLLSAHAFPGLPPPEVHALLSENEKRLVDSLSVSPRMLELVPEQIASSPIQGKPAPDPRQSRTGARIQVAVNFGINKYHRLGYDHNLSERWFSGWTESNFVIAADIAVDLPVLAFSDRGAGVSLRPHVGGSPFIWFGGAEVVLHSNGPFYLASGVDYQVLDNNYLNFEDDYDFVEQSNFSDHLFLSVGAGFAWTSTFLEFQWRTAIGTPLYSVGPKELWLEEPWTLPRDRRFTTVLMRYGWRW